ncbi:50S ribosomal protein L6 [Amphiplicatus metriothermophilus]|uniref:Large ribosomal subunit protein uL6 n=1 Tax=Amphiplicatus metriothermophilus TaxID=1519374 RepID=A0A239PQQ9_9PROT|nr:50S ribosomal protein L6 [Amphiplicatus metriothermophilus]MBB5518559.1 large subunit ribosomal protein L6 [Amphiplicatus metriothermophilus]SNT72282.1 LSU ribosomal protein L6P [Amphiplicatus metriothermophilus]
MSRIGKRPVPVPKSVTVTVDGQTVKAKGPKGELEFVVNELCRVALENDKISVEPVNLSKPARAQWGMNRTMIANMMAGVTEAFTKKLELVGVGYRAAMKGSALNLQLGFSHEIDFPVPKGVKIETPKPTEIVISGIDKQLVGETAAKIRAYRPPEPYKGKGVKYEGEYIFRKEGKKK